MHAAILKTVKVQLKKRECYSHEIYVSLFFIDDTLHVLDLWSEPKALPPMVLNVLYVFARL